MPSLVHVKSCPTKAKEYTGPNDDYRKIFATLEESCGKGNFDYEIDERAQFRYDG